MLPCAYSHQHYYLWPTTLILSKVTKYIISIKINLLQLTIKSDQKCLYNKYNYLMMLAFVTSLTSHADQQQQYIDIDNLLLIGVVHLLCCKTILHTCYKCYKYYHPDV